MVSMTIHVCILYNYMNIEKIWNGMYQAVNMRHCSLGRRWGEKEEERNVKKKVLLQKSTVYFLVLDSKHGRWS